jgi:predicted transcriptional regulator
MASLSITEIPDSVTHRLQSLAEQAGVDVETMIRRCLVQGIEQVEQVEQEIAELRRLRAGMPGVWITDEELDRAINEGRE